MKLGQILKILELKMPSKLADEDWIAYLNTGVRRYGRHLGKSDFYTFNVTDRLKYYPLPSYIKGEDITAVVLNGQELEPVRYSEELTDGSYCLDPTGFIMFGGSYRTGTEVSVLFDTVTPFVTLSELAAETNEETAQEMYTQQDCGCDDEYIDAVIYAAMSEAALTAEDISAASNYKQLAEEIVRDAKQSRYRKKGKYPVTKISLRQKWRDFKWRHIY